MILKKSIFLIFAFLILYRVSAQNDSINVLVFSKTQAFRHKSIPTGIQFLSDMGNKNN